MADATALAAASWVSAGLTPSVSLTGLASGTLYAFQTRSKDEAGNYSPATRIFYETTPGDPVPPAAGPLAFSGDGLMFMGDRLVFNP
jgi:hypothetical protein